MQNLSRTFHGFNLQRFQIINHECHHPIERLHTKVIVVVLLKYGRGIDDM